MRIEDALIKGAVFVFLCICAVFDIRKKEIPFASAVSGMAAAGVLTLWRIGNGTASAAEIILSLLPGAFFLLVSRCTKEKVGYGDGLLLLITGLAVGFYQCFFGLCISLLLSAFFAAFLLILRKAEKESRIPFVPFLAAGMGVCFII